MRLYQLSGGRVCQCGGSTKSYGGRMTHKKSVVGGNAPLLLSNQLGYGLGSTQTSIQQVNKVVNAPIPNTETLQKKLASLNTSKFKGKGKYANL